MQLNVNGSRKKDSNDMVLTYNQLVNEEHLLNILYSISNGKTKLFTLNCIVKPNLGAVPARIYKVRDRIHFPTANCDPRQNRRGDPLTTMMFNFIT